MRFHPLNPMTKSRVKDLMEMQSRYPAEELGALSSSGREPSDLCGSQSPCYLIPDYETEEDGMRIAARFPDEKLYTGGSGLCEALAAVLRARDKKAAAGSSVYEFPAEGDGRFLVLAGSCSEMTGRQIRCWKEKDLPSLHLDPVRLLDDPESLTAYLQAVRGNRGALLIHSLSDDGKTVSSRYTQQELSSALDHAFEALGRAAVGSGTRRILAAGGETSGAICKALQNRFFYIGKSLAPGVPLLFPDTLTGLHLALKSGNFGDEAFFVTCSYEL